jgi:serine/threonine protein kinase
MSVIYKGLDMRLNRSVAIKVLPPSRLSDANRRRLFVPEAKAASALDHPNIITVCNIVRAE